MQTIRQKTAPQAVGEMTGFLDINAAPRARALSRRLMVRTSSLMREGRRLFEDGRFAEWPETINGGGWRVFGVKWQGEMLAPDTAAACALEGFDELVVNAGYSLMLPGTEITPHVGYSGDVLRMHLGLIVPPGDCAIIVGGERRCWEPGGILFFDDTVEHSAHNRTQGARLIFLLDVIREEL